jgi:hypothetical protein
MADFTDEAPPQKGEPLFLGVLGSRNDITQGVLIERILNPVLQELGRPPDKAILPSEGTSSIFLTDWAESLKIPHQVYEADWQRHARRAKIFRDARIQQESTHFIVFLNKRSEFNEKLATRLARQGHTVFTVSWKDCEVEQLIIEAPPSSESPPARPAERGSKRGTGKGSARKGAQTLSDRKSHSPLLALWASSCQTASPESQSE